MILFYNVYLDDKVREPGLFYRGLYGDYSDHVDTFKYALASVAEAYPWKKVIINVELNPTISDRKDEVFTFIKDLFSSHDLELNNKRCEYQSDWQDLYLKLDDELIYFCCNHDHIFVDSNPQDFIEMVDEFREEFSNKDATLYFSHWPEVTNLFLSAKGCTHAIHPDQGGKGGHDLTVKNTFAFTTGDCFDSIQIITKQVYHKWWFTGDFNDMFLPRTDYFTGTIPTQYVKFQAVPFKEYFRHFDGYTHIGSLEKNPTLQSKAANVCPPLFIPPGFFENNIKLKVGYDDNCKDSININLKKSNYTVVDPSGTDLKCFHNQVPYFWKSRISGVDINPSYDELGYTKERDESILLPLTCGIFHGSYSEEKVLGKIIKYCGIKT